MTDRLKRAGFIEVREEVWEQLWRVVDTARFATRTPHGSTEDEIGEALADDLKMLDRAIGGEEKTLRGEKATKHPRTLEIEEKERVCIRQLIEEV